MINQSQVPAYLLEELPEIIREFKYIYPSLSIYKTIYCLSNYTSRRVMQHDFKAVEKCFDVAEDIYCRGDLVVRNAIETVFVYSFPPMTYICNKADKKALQSIMPSHLQSVYKQHLLKLGL